MYVWYVVFLQSSGFDYYWNITGIKYIQQLFITFSWRFSRSLVKLCSHLIRFTKHSVIWKPITFEYWWYKASGFSKTENTGKHHEICMLAIFTNLSSKWNKKQAEICRVTIFTHMFRAGKTNDVHVCLCLAVWEAERFWVYAILSFTIFWNTRNEE